ncbi:MAG: HEPN domain-containing protein [Chitinophagaceae bacterium]|nr:HEPN domain-containing protein [Chitinophagaceae bacterium]
MVLIKRTHEASYNSLQDKIESTCLPICPVTAIVLEFEQFNQWLKDGHRFAYQVRTKATLLFEDLSVSFGDVNEVAPDTIKAFREAAHTKGLDLMQEFLAGADLYKVRQQNKMAAFMLHQAAEFGLHAILKISIGLCVNSHNLDKLIRYCSIANSNVSKVFNRHIENEKRLFQLLQRAYIETRYKETYSINNSDLLEITNKIALLQEILVSLKY